MPAKPPSPSSTEYPFSKGLLKKFFNLASGRPARSGAVPIACSEAIPPLGESDRFRKFWVPIPGNPNFDNTKLFDRLFECLGSYADDRNFNITEQLLNVVEGAIMQNNDPMAYENRLEKTESRPNDALAILRSAIASFEYMNTNTGPNVHGKMTNILNGM
ncbi:hypothetical protein FOMG_13318 [Fusarium oxysporum f. sp. melonis 26406]|uniref:Uncharacterized protein n=1 Tax=Fusarium oxysporum f. sp. melonis 26406 TaxID=1089452 RepID=W9ZQG2_FUSOX|nr:hypothetical protein FOMG_13318 [Fusarium oxysporum f. sp. melonis 26406]